MTDLFENNKILNEKEIKEKKIKLKSSMKRLIVTLSSRCNLDCIMCEVRRTKWDIPEGVIREIKGLFPCLESISWQGGEPFLLEYFRDLFDEASKFSKLKQTIVTNGLFITDVWAQKLVKNNVELTFSIDGVTSQVYEHIRPGSKFSDVLKNLKIIQDKKKESNSNRFFLRLHVVVMKSNYFQLEDFIDFAKEYEFDAIHLISMWGSQARDEDIFYQQDREALDYIEDIRNKLEEKAKRYNIQLLNALPKITISLDDKYAQPEINTCDKEILCRLPWEQLNVDPGGGVRPDCLCLKSVGNVLENSLKDLWNNESMQIYRKKILEKDTCSLCNPTCLAMQMSRKVKEYKVKLFT